MSTDLLKLKKDDLKQIIKSEKMGLVTGKNKAGLIKLITDFRNKKNSSSSSSSRTAEKVKIYHDKGDINIYVGSQPQTHQEAVARSYASQYAPSTSQPSSSTEHTPNLSNQAINPIKKWDTVKTTEPIKKVQPAKISAKAQKNKEKISAELSQIKPKKLDPAFKATLEDLFR
jgi:flagellar hook-length control protein FliK